MDLLSDSFRVLQRHPAIAPGTSLVFDGDPGDEISVKWTWENEDRLTAGDYTRFRP